MLFLSAAQALDLSSLDLSVGDICLRLLCAMVVGMIIGTEREYTHRPAGMRTHILVALGACSVMITGQMIFAQYLPLGGMPDPSRLSAQVITGVGFLGAGTILREGANVKGLTTAASLWAVACLGIAAGAGYYTVALAGMVFIFITLTIFEVFQNKLVGPGSSLQHYHLNAPDVSPALQAINRFAQQYRVDIHNILCEQQKDGSFHIAFCVDIGGIRHKSRRQKFLENLAADPSVASVRLCRQEDTATPM